MNAYKLKLTEDANSLVFHDENDVKELVNKEYLERFKNWKELTVNYNDELTQKTDFNFDFVTTSQVAITDNMELFNILKEFGELRPIKEVSGDLYHSFFCTNFVDALDVKKSKFKNFKSSGRIMKILKYSFKKEILLKPNIFLLPYGPQELFITEPMKNLLTFHNYTGIEFKPVK